MLNKLPEPKITLRIKGGILIPELGGALRSRGIDNFDTPNQRSTRFGTANESADQLFGIVLRSRIPTSKFGLTTFH